MRPTTTNKVLLIGYVSADPEKLELKNGGVGAKFRMATYQSYTELGSAAEVKMEFHRIVGFGDARKGHSSDREKGPCRRSRRASFHAQLHGSKRREANVDEHRRDERHSARATRRG
jgi:hypothetical protein